MIRSEYAANIALIQTQAPAAWTKPSTCKRAPRSLFARIFNLK